MAQSSRFPLLVRLAAAREGSVAIIFAAIIIPVIGITAAAIDFGRAANVRSTLQTAASAAAQAASARLLEDRSVVEQQAKAMLAANLPADLKDLPHRLTIASDRGSVEVSLETSVSTSLMGLFGMTEIPVEATGFARPMAIAAIEQAISGETSSKPDADVRPAVPLWSSRGFNGAGASHEIPSFGPPAGRMPTLNQAEARLAARAIEEQLRDLRTRFENGEAKVSVPAEARAEIERVMREFRRNVR